LRIFEHPKKEFIKSELFLLEMGVMRTEENELEKLHSEMLQEALRLV